LITEEERLEECVPDDILFVVQDKMKTKSSPKSKKTKATKGMKDDNKKKNPAPRVRIQVNLDLRFRNVYRYSPRHCVPLLPQMYICKIK
jgi:hypothetical protein